MILRVGLLEQAGRPFFCLVRNVSPTGIQVKLYNSRTRIGEAAIRVGDESVIAGQIVWVKGGHAGISFIGDIDPALILRLQQRLGPAGRRATPRAKATSCAAVHVGKRVKQAVLRDISCMGARIATSRPLESGALACIRVPDLPEIKARGRWSERSEAGLAFETPLAIGLISQWLDGRLRVAA